MSRVAAVALLVAVLTISACGSSSGTSSKRQANEPVVLSVGSGGRPGIYRLEPDGTVRRLTRDESDMFPTWSPDGTKVAFERIVFERGAAVGDVHLFVMNGDGSGLRDVVGSASVGPFSWSPGGDDLAYRDGDGRIRTIGIDGTGEELVYRAEFAHEPAWSPDGKTIVFFEDTLSLDSGDRLVAIDAEGGSPRVLLRLASRGEHVYDAASPTWSPDGKQIAFVRGEPFASPSVRYPSALEVVRADGRGRRVLTKLRLAGLDAEVARPTWSPDERSIVFTDGPEGDYGLWSVSSGGGEPRLLLDGVKHAMPSWPSAGA